MKILSGRGGVETGAFGDVSLLHIFVFALSGLKIV